MFMLFTYILNLDEIYKIKIKNITFFTRVEKVIFLLSYKYKPYKLILMTSITPIVFLKDQYSSMIHASL